MVSILLVSAFSHPGVFTNWRIIDGTSGIDVTFHLDMDNAVFTTEGASHELVEDVLWNKSQDELWIPFGYDDESAWNRKRTEAKNAQPVIVVKWYKDHYDWHGSGSRGLERKSITLVNVNTGSGLRETDWSGRFI